VRGKKIISTPQKSKKKQKQENNNNRERMPGVQNYTPSSHSASRALARIVIKLQRHNNLLFSLLNVFSFQFFTKGKKGNYFCPCSSECQDATHAENPISEWNGKNIKKMARGNRVVYILCLCKVHSGFLQS